MKEILLANIGNRNIYCKNPNGDFIMISAYIKEMNLQEYMLINEQFHTEDYDIRKFTRKLWERLEKGEENSENIDLRVLSFDDLTEKPYSHLYLFYTDQDLAKQAYQDTLYIVKIMQYLIENKFPNIVVNPILISKNPTDEKNLYEQYSQITKKLIQEHFDNQFVFHDLGGTPQMKNATKVILEYYLKQNKKSLNVRYKDHWSENSRETDRGLHIRYLLLDVASEFIRNYNFAAAAEVLSRSKDLDSLCYHLQIAENRLQFKERPSPAEYKTNSISSIPTFENYTKKILPKSFLPTFPISARVIVFEISSICQFYFDQENYTLGVATFYRLSEELAQCYIENFSGLLLEKDFQRKSFIEQIPNSVKDYFSKGDLRYGLPLLLAYCHEDSKNKPSSQLSPLFAALLPTCSIINGQQYKGMNQLRNRCWLAHDNRAITKKDIELEVPDFYKSKGDWSKIKNSLGLPIVNVFVEMQQNLLDILKM